ncbi:glycosyltransferase [Mastigocladopsis repens]|uniref:glycosyltransferase n=1 Tax=Mastigocladopsis repens TaxID=221287 RepID=UPI00037A47FB|nr:glycosyltransferase [Mastigocladopsis repens]
MKPLAIVTTWFGKNLKGGAEQQAWQIATRLANRGHQVEILTTCCRSFLDDWGVNHLKVGLSQDEAVKIRRFQVANRNSNSFNCVNSFMLSLPSGEIKPGVNPVSLEEAAIFCEENINSIQLLDYLRNQREQYQAFLFLPYLYGPILNGLPIIAERAFLQPCLHDEVYAYLPQVAKIFHEAKGLLFNSEGEAQLAINLYGPGIIPKSIIVGEGVEVGRHYDTNLTHIGEFPVKQERFILYLGRRDSTKKTDFLVKAYATFRQKHPDSSLRLVLAGPGNTSFNGSVPGLVDLGLVQESEKETLLANCLALFQPSRNESYSRVIMEAWFYERPVAAHQDCLATAMAVESSKGGWLAGTEIEWAELFAKIDQMGDEHLAKYGANGKAYAQENAVWDKVIERYETVLGLSEKQVTVSNKPTKRTLKEIHQLLPGFTYGDAISNQARAIRDYLRNLGYKSNIFVEHLDPAVAKEGKKFQPDSISPQAGLIYHHSIGCEVTDYAIAHPGTKCLIYHNITPAEFFLAYRPEIARLLEQGRADLKQLAPHFPLSVGVSAYNAAELMTSGFAQPGILPIGVTPNKWDMPADATLMRQLQDGKTNLLFVGRFSPNKRQDHLVEAFDHYLTMDHQARLILVGGGDINDPYYRHIMSIIESLNLTQHVMIPGKINDAQLLAFYKTAQVFWSMSEHEGFCVPLVEAMWFDVPILAYKSSAVPETLGEAGLMFTSKDDFVQVAALAKLLVKDKSLRAKVIAAQRKRRVFFTQLSVNQYLSNLILKLEENFK